MKRIKVIALDYGLTFGIDRAIRDLVDCDALTGIGVIAASEMMGREAKPLYDCVQVRRNRPCLGLELALTAPFAPLSDAGKNKFGEVFPTIRAWSLRLRAGLIPRRVLAEEIRAQHAAFIDQFGEPPHFVDGWQNCHLALRVRKAFLSVASQLAWAPDAWYRADNRDHWSWRRFADRAAPVGISVSRQVITIAAGQGGADMHEGFFRQAGTLQEGAVVLCRPAEIDDRLRKLDPQAGHREAVYRFLTGPDFALVLREHDMFLY